MMRWWWFGPAVTSAELSKELEQMHSVGIGGVEIQPVYPLAIDDPAKGINNLPFLSQPFLDAVTFANDRARALGMRVDITLGSGWPYGGPHTTLDNAAGCLRIASAPISGTSVDLPHLTEGESLIAAFQVTGQPSAFDPQTAERLVLSLPSTSIKVTPGAGQIVLFFIASHTKQTVKRPSAGAEGFVLDHFSRAAIDAHLASVAIPLLSAFGTSPPESVFSDSLEVYGSDWTADLPAEFRRRRGYDLIPHLPELAQGGTPAAELVRHDWGLTLSDLIRENYLGPINNFALQHHSKFRSQTYGEPAVTLADESVPALPEGEGPQWRTFSFTRWASSASHVYGRNITSAETWTWLHSPAFRATPLDMKVEADRMFLQGVNQIVGHGWPYSPRAAAEPGWSLYAAAVFNAHNPWWPVMPDVMLYLHRTSWLLRQGEPANDIAILLPEDDAQASFSPAHVSVTDEMKKRITPELTSTILDSGYNFDYTDAAAISTREIAHSILILPPTDLLPLATLIRLEDFVLHGGKVLAIGRLPQRAPGLQAQSESATIAARMRRLFEGSGSNAVLIASTAQLPAALHKMLAADLSVSPRPEVPAQDPSAGLGFIHRKLAQGDLYFVVNSSNQPLTTALSFRAKFHSLEIWDPETGRLVENRESGPLSLTFAPYQSLAFILSNDPVTPVRHPAHARQQQAERDTPLDTGWTIQFPAERPEAIRTLTSWTALPRKQFFSGEVVYSHALFRPKGHAAGERSILDFGPCTPTIDNRPPDAPGIHANLDPPIREAAVIFVNGLRAGSLWHPPYQVDISPLLHDGENRIDVHVFNTAINVLAGQPPRDYSALEARYGRRFVPQDMDNLVPLPSGILHQVRVRYSDSDRPEMDSLAVQP